MRTETDAAVGAARLARHLADSRAGADAIQVKQGIDIVTGADVACEEAIRATLSRAFPYPIVGEERGGEPRADEPYWLVDPICGTRCYASEVPLYCTNIALVEHGEVTAAVISVGRSNDVLYAERNGGAWLMTDGDATRIEHPSRRAGDIGTITTGAAPLERDQKVHRVASRADSNVIWIHGRGEAFANFARAAWSDERWYVCSFPSTVAYAYLAAGRIAGIVHIAAPGQRLEPPVHTAAGSLVVQEAGATISDADTRGAWSLETRSFIIAATPQLHRELTVLVEKSR